MDNPVKYPAPPENPARTQSRRVSRHPNQVAPPKEKERTKLPGSEISYIPVHPVASPKGGVPLWRESKRRQVVASFGVMNEACTLSSGASPASGTASSACSKELQQSVDLRDGQSAFTSWELGISLLQQGRPCTRQALGALRRVFQNALVAGDLLSFIDDCGYLRTKLVTGSEWSADLSKGQNRRWVRGLITAIEHVVPANLIVHPSDSFNRVTTFLGWLKRLPVCIRAEEISVDEYYKCDRRISLLDFKDNVYVPMLRRIWAEWFGSFKLQPPFRPRHGSGATADVGRVRAHKWQALHFDRVAHICLRYPNLQPSVESEPRFTPRRVSKALFVPKQAGKDRTICMEPSWLQYLQQGVARQLIDYTHSLQHPLHRFVNVFSQEKNRELCARAYYEDGATIDLSDASDSVSWRLVTELTRGLPLQRYLHGTRSTHTILDGHVVRMDKFAPMGSALCFPIECFVFTSIVELAYREHYGQASRGFQSGISVYGDDIVCPRAIYHRVETILTSLGFKVNATKSFSSGAYFESCGVEYLHGVSIKSIKHPRRHLHCHEAASPDMVGTVSDLANSLLLQGYFLGRRHLLKAFEDVKIDLGTQVVPFMDFMWFDDKSCIPIIAPYVRSRWNCNLQRREYTVKSIGAENLSADSDYQQATADTTLPTRDLRLRHLTYPVVRVDVDERFSQRAVVALSKFGFFDLLEGRDIQDVGHTKTGRLRYKVRRKAHPVVHQCPTM